MHRDEEGSAAVESIFSMFFLMFLVVGTIQVGLTLYARNVLASAAHEGARSAIELGSRPGSAATVAERTILLGTGGVADDIAVETTMERSRDRVAVRVRVRGTLRTLGPIPMAIPVASVATVSRARLP